MKLRNVKNKTLFNITVTEVKPGGSTICSECPKKRKCGTRKRYQQNSGRVFRFLDVHISAFRFLDLLIRKQNMHTNKETNTGAENNQILKYI